jgi:hypothetical protein
MTNQNLINTLVRVKEDFENAIKRGGIEATHSLIRSQKLIGLIHEYIKNELISHGIEQTKIYPPLDSSGPELTMVGFLKNKKQDITILPESPKEENVQEGVLFGKKDKIGKEVMEKSISINVRSQLSSIGKNFDTLFERTFAEPLNLHLRVPKLVMGEVYMIPVISYDPDLIKDKKIGWDEKLPVKYIPAFRELNGRQDYTSDYHKYERLCLLIVDFRENPPKVITSAKDLIKADLIDTDDEDKFSLEGMDIFNFVHDILKIYEKRHGNLGPLKETKGIKD